MVFQDVISVGALSTLVMEGIKTIIRLFKPGYDLPAVFYVLAIPLVNALMPFVLVFMGLLSNDAILLMSLPEVGKYLLMTLVSSLISVVGYNDALKPLKEYAKLQASK